MADLSGRRVLVTGAGGFIGGNLVARLVRDGARVRGLVRYTSRGDRGTLDWLAPEITAEVDVVQGELRDVESADRAVAGTDVVMHLGAQVGIPYSYVNSRDYVEVNVLGTLNVAQAVLRHDVERLVQTSTSEVYGTARRVPITEDHPLEPQSPYAASKVASDKLVDSFHRSFGLPAVILRPFNTFGPMQSARAVVPTIITQALAGDVVRLGALAPRRDLTFVDDTVEGFIAAASVPGVEGRTVHLGTNREVSIGDLVEMVSAIVGRTLRTEVDPGRVRPAESEVERLLSDPALANDLLGWRPRVDLEDGLERTLEWIRGHADRYRIGEYAT